jgi:hypothetical protein
VPQNDHAELSVPSPETRWPEIVHNSDREFLGPRGVPDGELSVLLYSSPGSHVDLVSDRGFEVRLGQKAVDKSEAIFTKYGWHGSN